MVQEAKKSYNKIVYRLSDFLYELWQQNVMFCAKEEEEEEEEDAEWGANAGRIFIPTSLQFGK
jgi:hypothetical protein